MRKIAQLFSCTLLAAAAALAQDQFSDAEQLLFLADQLGNVSKSAVIRYSYAKRGSLDAAADGSVSLTVSPMSEGSGRHVHVDFLNGSQKFELPDIDNATSNPIILFFLERDVRDMERRTGGKASYFRKRVRLALAESAQVEPVQLDYEGHSVSGKRIRIQPFSADPLRPRFEKLADKVYVFTLSDAVPGRLYSMQTQARAPKSAEDGALLLEESITLIGAQP